MQYAAPILPAAIVERTFCSYVHAKPDPEGNGLEDGEQGFNDLSDDEFYAAAQENREELKSAGIKVGSGIL